MVFSKRKTIDSFNEYVKSLKKKGNFSMTLTKFNGSGVNIEYAKKPIEKVPLLTEKNYCPNMATPLYDAIGKTIVKHEKEISKGAEILFVILTDGEENSSNEYNLASVKKMIEEREGKGWTFFYMGLGPDAWVDITKMGIRGDHNMFLSRNHLSKNMKRMALHTEAFIGGGSAIFDESLSNKY